jgi:hypothetical protein
MTLEMIGAVLGSVLFIGTIKYWLSNNKKQADKIKLGLALIVHIQKIISSCQQHRGISNAILQGNKTLKIQLKSSSKLIKDGVDNLIATIENKILIDDRIDMDASEFFKMATQPIDALVTVYQNLVAHAVRNA